MDAKSLLSAAARVLHLNADCVCVCDETSPRYTSSCTERQQQQLLQQQGQHKENRLCRRLAKCCDVLLLSLHSPESCRNVQAGTPPRSACSCPRKGKVSFVVSVHDQSRDALNVHPALQSCLSELNPSPITKPGFNLTAAWALVLEQCLRVLSAHLRGSHPAWLVWGFFALIPPRKSHSLQQNAPTYFPASPSQLM